MASNQLIRIPRKRTAKPVTTNRLEEIEKTLDKMWSMFQTQVERNFELMSIIQKQQENSHTLTFSLPQIEPAPSPVTAQKEMPVETKDIPELGYEKLKRLEVLVGSVVNVRKDALQTITNVFHYLYQYGGEAYPEQLIGLAGISTATFYRYLDRMSQRHLIMMKRGKAVITETGKKLYTEEIKTVVEIKEAIYKDKYHCEPPEALYKNPSVFVL
jgi:predicted transcriptional regulator